MKLYATLLLLFLPTFYLSAQQKVSDAGIGFSPIKIAERDSVELPSLTHSYYQDIIFLEHEYDYEAINRINNLKMWSREVMMLGYTTFLGIVAINAVLAINNDWPLWIDIPCATVVASASIIAFSYWSKDLREKAEALGQQTICLYNLNQQMDIGVVCFTNTQNHSLETVGLGIQVKF